MRVWVLWAETLEPPARILLLHSADRNSALESVCPDHETGTPC